MRDVLAWLGGGAVILGALALGLACVDQAIVAENADRPDVALKWRPDYPDALARSADDAARAAKSDAQWKAAGDLARRAIAASPMESRALRVLAWDAAHAGRDDRADAIMNVAGGLTQRDSRISGWLLSAAIARRDWSDAFPRVDALLRSEPDLGAALYPTIISTLGDPAARDALVERLALRPDWREDFLDSSAKAAGDLASTQALFHAVDASRTPLSQSERASLVEALIAHREFAAARAEWGRLLPAARRADLLYDGGFRGLPGGPPFNWVFVDNQGAVSELGAAPGGEPALHLQYPQARTDTLLQQLLVLPAGAYRLTGFVQFDHVGRDEELVWRVTCAGSGVLAEQRLMPARPGWNSFAIDFNTPATQCPAQQLSLSSLAQADFGVLQAWMRDVALSPAPDRPG